MTQHNTTARASRRADGHFTTIANAAIRDPRLSWKAKGILAGALSHGPGFRFNREWFVVNGTDGGAAIRSAFQELRDHGYLVTERIVGRDGKFKGGSLHFSDDPSLLPEEENHMVENRVADFPPGGAPATIRRSIERTPTEEDQLDTPYPLKGDEQGQDDHFPHLRKMVHDAPAAGGTLVADPQPQRTDPAPSPPKRIRMAKPKSSGDDKPQRFTPTTDDVPASLLPVEAALRAFWQVKKGERTRQAWNGLTGSLERIWKHPMGGMEAVRDQLDWAIQAAPRSITFCNWQKFGMAASVPGMATGRRKSATESAADAAKAFYNALESA